MGNTRISAAERLLIEDLLTGGMKPEIVGVTVGRSVRSVYYVQAELLRRSKKPSLLRRIFGKLTGELHAEKTKDPRRVGQNRRAEV